MPQMLPFGSFFILEPQIMSTVEPYRLLFRQPASMHHSVIVDGFDEAGLLIIRDPAQGTMYKMTYEDFETFWSGYGVFYQP